MFRRNLKLLRIAKGYTQEKMAEILGIPHLSYTKIEGGSRNLPPDIVKGLTELFECSADDLLLRTVKVVWDPVGTAALAV